MENNIDKLFKDAFYDKKMEVSGKVWDNIAKSLPVAETPTNPYTKWYGLAALLASGLMVSTILLSIEINMPEVVQNEQNKTQTPDQIEKLEERRISISDSERTTPNSLNPVSAENLSNEVTYEEEVLTESENEEVSLAEENHENQATSKVKKLKYLPIFLYKKEDQLYARFNINNLKQNGALLVRLNTKKNSIAELEAKGMSAQAKKLKKAIREENKMIMESFKNNFDFCPVFFFYTDQTANVKSENLERIFINSNGDVDPSIQMNQPFYLIADIGSVKDKNGNIDPLLTRAIVLKDKEFDQLKDPFPFVQASSNPDRTPKHVEKLNKKLQGFYEFVQNNN